MDSFTTDAAKSKREGDIIRLSPDATKLVLEWTLDPAADKDIFQTLLLRYRREVGFWPGKRSEMSKAPAGFLTDSQKSRPAGPLSFQLVLGAWKTEYARRFTEHVKQGGKPKTYHPVAMQTPEERAKEGVIVRPIENFAMGKKVTSSPGSTHPESANDGIVSNTAFWECNAGDAWWQVDLGKSMEISALTVVPLHTDDRAYRFVVKTSMDGTRWTVHIDKRDNQEAFGVRGCEEKFQLTPMRFIRVEMFDNTLNPGNHLVELISR